MHFSGSALLLTTGVACLTALARSMMRCDAIEERGSLHQVRSGVGTIRARLCYAADCRLIAQQMNKVEQAKWRCQ